MEFADRNDQETYYKGHYGITGTFAQKIKEIVVSHDFLYTNGLLVVDSTAGEVIITLPPLADLKVVDEYRHIFPIMHVGGGNNVKIKCSGSETFANGATFFNLGIGLFCFDLYAIRSANLSIYGLYTPLTVKAAVTFGGTWDTGDFGTVAIAPLDTLKNNTQDEILLLQTLSNGIIASAATSGGGTTTTFTDVAHGLTTGDVITIAGTTSYNDEYAVTVLTDDTYSIVEAFVADESGTWIRSPRFTVLLAGDYKIGYQFTIVSSGGAAWVGEGSLFKNGTVIADTIMTKSGIVSGTESWDFAPLDITLAAGDYIDLRVDNTTLTGALTLALLSIETVV